MKTRSITKEEITGAMEHLDGRLRRWRNDDE